MRVVVVRVVVPFFLGWEQVGRSRRVLGRHVMGVRREVTK